MPTEMVESGSEKADAGAIASQMSTGAEGEGSTPEIPEERIAEARAQGWVPKEEFRGPEDKWIDAETFIKRGEELTPIIKRQNAGLKSDLAAARAEIENLKKDMQDVAKYTRAQAEREYNAQLAELRRAKAEAITAGDGERVTEIEGKIDNLPKPEAPKKEEPAPVQLDERTRTAGVAFAQRNPWFGDQEGGDPRKTRLAMAVAAEVRASKPGLAKADPDAYFAEIETALNRDYPEIFGRTTKAKALTDGGGAPGGAVRGGKAKGFADMPADAQAQALRFEKNSGVKKEDYARTYWEEQGAA